METYRSIVEDLTRRIDSGALCPGDRLPSTRALARKWKVANTTAARALTELVRSGHARAVPRSGTVVAASATSESAPLSRERIVATAIHMADAAGLEALSVRGLASQLDVPVMSLYRHVRSRDELVALMTDAALAEFTLPDTPPQGWRAQFELGARVEWQAMRRHPWLARVMHISRPAPLPHALAFVDWLMRALDATALDEAGKLQLHVGVHSFIQGLAVNVEAEAQAVAESGVTDAEYMHAVDAKYRDAAETGRYPFFTKVTRGVPDSLDMGVDAIFELGLRAILDGFAPLIESSR